MPLKEMCQLAWGINSRDRILQKLVLTAQLVSNTTFFDQIPQFLDLVQSLQ